MEQPNNLLILEYSGLFRDYAHLFIQHRIDDEALVEMTSDHLEQIGITNSRHRDLIISCRNRLVGQQKLEFKQFQKQEKENRTQVPITNSMLIRASPSQVKSKMETTEDFLRKLHIVNLSDKEISLMSNLQSCPRLQVLQLSNNFISEISSLQTLQCLRILYLDNNLIEEISGLTRQFSLQKLFLDRNRIRELKGLQQCSSLQELHLNNQDIQDSMSIDQTSVAGISRTLEKLLLVGNKISEVSNLWFCDSLVELDLSENLVQMDQGLLRALSCMRSLRLLFLQKNPLAKRVKYRDEMILCCTSVQELDGRVIHPNQKEFIYKLKGKKMGLIKDPVVKKAKTFSLEVRGNKMNQLNILLQKIRENLDLVTERYLFEAFIANFLN